MAREAEEKEGLTLPANHVMLGLTKGVTYEGVTRAGVVVKDRFKSLLAMEGAATAGPWLNKDWCDSSIRILVEGGSVGIAEVFGKVDRAFIVESRNSIKPLVEMVLSLEAALQQSKRALESLGVGSKVVNEALAAVDKFRRGNP